MNNDTQHFLELLEQRISLLGNLAVSLSAASTGLVAFDLDTIESRIREQERLCTDIRSLDGHIDAIQRRCSAHLKSTSPNSGASAASDPDSPRLRETIARLASAQSAVRQLNAAHQSLLRRSRRTVGALLNSYHTFASTYSDPASPRVSIGERL